MESISESIALPTHRIHAISLDAIDVGAACCCIAASLSGSVLDGDGDCLVLEIVHSLQFAVSINSSVGSVRSSKGTAAATRRAYGSSHRSR